MDEERLTIRFPADVFKEIGRQLEIQKKRMYISKNTFVVELIKAGLGMKLQAGLMPSKEKIGEGLVRLGKMTKAQAEKVLQVQREKYSFGKKFGEIALELMYINRATLDEYLGDA